MAKKLPYFPFFPGDWLKDTALRSCSEGARGTWMDLLCLMWDCPRRGVLRIKGEKITSKMIQKMIGNRSKFVQELIEKGVCQQAKRTGILYSRHMVRNSRLSLKRAIAGRKGGVIAQAKTPVFAQAKPQANTQAKLKQNPEYEYEDEYEGKGKKEDVYLDNPDFRKAMDDWWGAGRVNEIMRAQLGDFVDRFGAECVLRSITITARKGVRNMKYLQTVCENGGLERDKPKEPKKLNKLADVDYSTLP